MLNKSHTPVGVYNYSIVYNTEDGKNIMGRIWNDEYGGYVIGRVELDGRVRKILKGDSFVGRVDEYGKVYKGWDNVIVGRIAQDGRVYKGGEGSADGGLVGRVASDGRVFVIRGTTEYAIGHTDEVEGGAALLLLFKEQRQADIANTAVAAVAPTGEKPRGYLGERFKMDDKEAESMRQIEALPEHIRRSMPMLDIRDPDQIRQYIQGALSRDAEEKARKEREARETPEERKARKTAEAECKAREAARKAEEKQSRLWKGQGLCQYCGGKTGGYFPAQKCKSCGKYVISKVKRIQIILSIPFGGVVGGLIFYILPRILGFDYSESDTGEFIMSSAAIIGVVGMIALGIFSVIADDLDRLKGCAAGGFIGCIGGLIIGAVVSIAIILFSRIGIGHFTIIGGVVLGALVGYGISTMGWKEWTSK